MSKSALVIHRGGGRSISWLHLAHLVQLGTVEAPLLDVVRLEYLISRSRQTLCLSVGGSGERIYVLPHFDGTNGSTRLVADLSTNVIRWIPSDVNTVDHKNFPNTL
jgi:hypothetical protein